MRLVWFLRLLTLGLVFYADICAGAVPRCGAKWFGSPCRYKCHCENNNCDINGECTCNSTCEPGLFGPACQYVDLVSTSTTSSTPAWVYDFPDSRCNTGQGSVTISLNDTFYLIWLRLRVLSTGTSKEFTLQFANSKGKSMNCTNMQTFAVSGTVLDIQCDPGVWFQRVTITGDGVRSLCSVYISGGRIAALGQDTSQTFTYLTFGSWKAVDGDRHPNFDHGSCTHTNCVENNPAWTLIFQMPHQVTRYDVYNRDGDQHHLLKTEKSPTPPNYISMSNYFGQDRSGCMGNDSPVTKEDSLLCMYIINQGIYGVFAIVGADKTPTSLQLLQKVKEANSEQPRLRRSRIFGPTCAVEDCLISECRLPEIHRTVVLPLEHGRLQFQLSQWFQRI